MVSWIRTRLTPPDVLARKTGVLLAANAVAKMLGLLREVMVAAFFGATAVTDAFFAALRIPNVLLGALPGALGPALVPVVTALRAEGRQDRASAAASTVATVLGGLALGVALVVVLWPRALLALVAPGFDGPTALLTGSLARLIFPSLALMVAAAAATVALQAARDFTVPAYGIVVFSAVSAASVLAAAWRSDIRIAALGFSIGVCAQLALQLPAMRRHGFRILPRVDLADPSTRLALGRFAPLAAILLLGTAGPVAEVVIGSALPAGSLSALQYAQRIALLPVTAVVPAVASVSLPFLSQYAATGEALLFRSVLRRGLALLAITIIPVCALLVVFADPVVQIVFARRGFGSSEVVATSEALRYYAVGLPALGVAWVVAQAFYALHDVRTPLFAAAVAAVANVAFNLVLVGTMQHRGLALGFSIAGIVQAAILGGVLITRPDANGSARLLRVPTRSLVACAVLGAGVLGISSLAGWSFRVAPSALVLGLGVVVSAGVCAALLEMLAS